MARLVGFVDTGITLTTQVVNSLSLWETAAAGGTYGETDDMRVISNIFASGDPHCPNINQASGRYDYIITTGANADLPPTSANFQGDSFF